MILIEVGGATIEVPNFERNEFDCRCGCGFNNVKDMFLWRLQFARTEAQMPFIVNSGCRCPKHNASKRVGGKPDSDHLKGEAADIKVSNSSERWRVVNAAINAGFRRIGIGDGFVHLGVNWSNPQNVMWLY